MDPHYSAQDIVRCDLCETPAPPMCCDICHINLCKACVGEHLSDRSTEHKVVPFEERGSTINYPKCQKHSLKTCEVHCKHCNIPICASCFSSGDHDQHEKIDILKILTRKKELIKKDLQELNNSICPKFQQAASKIPAQKAGVKQHSLKLTTALNKHGEALHKEINSLIQRKQSEIEEMDKQHLAAITKQEDVINKALHEIEQVILDLQKLLDSDDVCLVSEYTSKNEEFRSLPAQFQVTLPTFSPQKINREQLYQQLGSLSQLLITFPLNDEAAGTTEVHGGLKKVSSPPARPLSDKPRIRTDIPTGCEPDDKAKTRSGGLVYSDDGDSSINLESTANDQRSVTIVPQVQEGLSATLKVAKVMEAGKSKKKNYNQNYAKLAGSNILFYKDLRASKSQPGSPNGRPEFIVPLQGASVERHGKEKNKKSIKLTTSQGDQYVLSFEDDYMLLVWLSNIDKTIISLE